MNEFSCKLTCSAIRCDNEIFQYYSSGRVDIPHRPSCRVHTIISLRTPIRLYMYKFMTFFSFLHIFYFSLNFVMRVYENRPRIFSHPGPAFEVISNITCKCASSANRIIYSICIEPTSQSTSLSTFSNSAFRHTYRFFRRIRTP